MDAKKPLTIAELHHQLVPEIVQAIVCKPIMHGGDLTDCKIVMEAVLVGVCETLERLRGPRAVPDLDFDRIVDNARAAASRRRQIAHAAAAKEPSP